MSQEHGRRWQDSEQSEMMLGDPYGVKAQLLSVDALGDYLFYELIGVLAVFPIVGGIVRQREAAQFNRRNS